MHETNDGSTGTISDDQIFALIAMSCLLLWLLSGSAIIPPAWRGHARMLAYAILGLGMLAAVVMTMMQVAATDMGAASPAQPGAMPVSGLTPNSEAWPNKRPR